MNADPLLILVPVVLIGTCLALLSSKRWVRFVVVIPVLIIAVVLSFGVGQTYERFRTLSNVTAPHQKFYAHLRELAEKKKNDALAESVIEFSHFHSGHMQDWMAVANKMTEIEIRNSEKEN